MKFFGAHVIGMSSLGQVNFAKLLMTFQVQVPLRQYTPWMSFQGDSVFIGGTWYSASTESKFLDYASLVFETGLSTFSNRSA